MLTYFLGLSTSYIDVQVKSVKMTPFFISRDETISVLIAKLLAIRVLYCSKTLETELDLKYIVEYPDRDAETVFSKSKDSLQKLKKAGVRLQNFIGLLVA